MGSVFVMSGQQKGFASYHFDALDNIYISYETMPAVVIWQGNRAEMALDNGNPLPRRKKFTNTHFPDAHAFTGEINWACPEKSSFHGQRKWIYHFKVDEAWTKIKYGIVVVFFSDPAKKPITLQY